LAALGALAAAGCGNDAASPSAATGAAGSAGATAEAPLAPPIPTPPLGSAPPPGATAAPLAPPPVTAAPAGPPAASATPAPPGTPTAPAPGGDGGGSAVAGILGIAWAIAKVLFWIVVVGLFVRGLAGWYAARNRRRWALPETADEVHYTTTSDRWRLAVHHWRPRLDAPARAGAVPVVLCHGLGANRFNMDADDRSLARWLRDRGWDVWVPELRGVGFSDDAARHDWCFDEHVEHDVPAVLELVLGRTGAAQVDWVGHSMGGMVMYAYLPRDQARVRSLCTVGSPGRMSAHAAPGGSALKRLRSLGRLVPLVPRWLMPRVPLRTLAAVLAPLSGVLLPRWQRAFHAVDNMDHVFLRRVAVSLPADISRETLQQFGEWFEEGSFRSLDRRRDYRERLGEIRIPVLALSGAADALAPPEAVEAAASRLGARAKVVVLGKAHGHGVDYGHGDLVVGDNAPHDVFPLIGGWLDAQARLEAAHGHAVELLGTGYGAGSDAEGGEDEEDEDESDAMTNLGAEATVPPPPGPGGSSTPPDRT
jgi:pimeloyl-ACP methyl ester carboxylesterase